MTDTEDSTAPLTRRQRRAAFVTHLYRLQRDLSSPNRHAASEARRQLAVLRRASGGLRYEAQRYDILFVFDPPRDEEAVWLTAAMLFAQKPHPRPVGPWSRASIGTAMGLLAQQRQASVARRFTQLVSVDTASLAHYLRQALQLVGGATTGVDFYRLLDDLVDLLGDDHTIVGEDNRTRIRLEWARDYSRALRGRPGRQVPRPGPPAPAEVNAAPSSD
ncbi:type I-E CRISPR-associated protein Cse2/CasB [Streptomyces sp. NPDC021020]|uniref:type I-E CRISPR-associated protein Cse2/CasB n=1 Tax=Streptomyces sp. NPDC021020 TaxID=3365109 RepID=UPI003799935A